MATLDIYDSEEEQRLKRRLFVIECDKIRNRGRLVNWKGFYRIKFYLKEQFPYLYTDGSYPILKDDSLQENLEFLEEQYDKEILEIEAIFIEDTERLIEEMDDDNWEDFLIKESQGFSNQDVIGNHYMHKYYEAFGSGGRLKTDPMNKAYDKVRAAYKLNRSKFENAFTKAELAEASLFNFQDEDVQYRFWRMVSDQFTYNEKIYQIFSSWIEERYGCKNPFRRVGVRNYPLKKKFAERPVVEFFHNYLNEIYPVYSNKLNDLKTLIDKTCALYTQKYVKEHGFYSTL